MLNSWLDPLRCMQLALLTCNLYKQAREQKFKVILSNSKFEVTLEYKRCYLENNKVYCPALGCVKWF